MLETSSTVSPGAVWTPLTNGVMTLGNNFVLTNDVGGSNAFYRLHDDNRKLPSSGGVVRDTGFEPVTPTVSM